jgi:hypothetical protein
MVSLKSPLELWDRDARIARRGGAVAQLGERRVRNAKVEGSIPFRSTSFLINTITYKLPFAVEFRASAELFEA